MVGILLDNPIKKVALVVEDHPLLADALVLSLAGGGVQAIRAELDDASRVLAQAARLRPSAVLLDLDLGHIDGLGLLPRLRAMGLPVLVVTGQPAHKSLATSLALGAWGWVSKSEPAERLVEAAIDCINGNPLLSQARHSELVDEGQKALAEQRELDRRLSALTAREHEVLCHLAEGHSPEDIASALFLSVGTVRSHVHGILSKLGVPSQLAAVAAARRSVVGA
jgi:DNA-binding NarL/FixJ family response regulator